MTGAAGESSLPLPDAIAQAHSNVLTQRLVAAAELQPLPIAEFMQRCLYEPGFGYYMAGAQKFGPDGDFITAPEVSPLFGSCIAAQCAEILAITGGGLLELGAGSGRLALSIIQALPAEHLSTYNIVEPSPELALRQAELLEAALPAEVFAKVCWLTELPSDFTGVILANEVMDALPVERLIRCRGGFAVEAVGLSREAGHPLACLDLPSAALSEAKGDELSAALQAIEVDIERAWPLDYRSEVSLLLSPWVQSLAQSLASGVCLLIDYGYPRREYYLAERNNGTLRCFYRHRAHDDITYWPGLQDITAHVDFTTVVEAGDAAGLSFLGYTSQAGFLIGCGLAEKATREAAVWQSDRHQGTAARVLQQQAINRLTLPGEMGERFQVMALGRNVDCRLRGFSVVDLSHRL